MSGHEPAVAAELYGEKLIHIHVHDNDGKKDQHLPPFSGGIDWQLFVSVLRRIGYSGIFQMEVSASSLSSNRENCERIQSLIAQTLTDDADGV